MKQLIPISVLLLYMVLAGFNDEQSWLYDYEPIFMERSEMEANIKLADPRTIHNPGKIYIKDNFIFINEKYLGVHVIDNTNPESPENFAFISIDGCIDMAVKNNVLYADNAVDLIAIRFNPEVTDIDITSRTKNVFPVLTAPDGTNLTWQQKQASPKNSILVRWKKR